jgi:hypothetical protein
VCFIEHKSLCRKVGVLREHIYPPSFGTPFLDNK